MKNDLFLVVFPIGYKKRYAIVKRKFLRFLNNPYPEKFIYIGKKLR